MAKWYYKQDENELGPIPASELKTLATTSEISASTLIRREDMPNWVLAGNVKELFPAKPPVTASENASGNPTEKPVKDMPASVPQDAMESSAARLMTGLRSATAHAAKQIELKKLEWSLSSADEKTGAKAYSSKITKDELSEIATKIVDIGREVKELREPELIVADEAMTDKAKRLAVVAKKKVRIEACLAERKKLLRVIGASFRNGNLEDHPELAEELKVATEITAQIEKVKTEIQSIDSPLSRLTKRTVRYLKLGAVAAAILGILYLGSTMVFRSSDDDFAADLSAELSLIGPEQERFAAMQEEAEVV